MSTEEELLDRMLEQSSTNEDDDDINSMWERELLDLKQQLQATKEQEELDWKTKTKRDKKRDKKLKLHLDKLLPGAAARSTALPPYITDPNLFYQREARRRQRKRLKQVQSSFTQFPSMRRHIFKQFVGSRTKKPHVTAKQATLRTNEWENNRLRIQLKRAAKKVLHCCNADYVSSTNSVKLLIEISRTSMKTKILLHKAVPNNENEGEQQQNAYSGADFGVDAGLNDLHERHETLPPGKHNYCCRERTSSLAPAVLPVQFPNTNNPMFVLLM